MSSSDKEYFDRDRKVVQPTPVIPRPLSLVRQRYDDYQQLPDRALIFLGEIPNMPDHCVLLDSVSHNVYAGYHTDGFVELTEDET